jgi:hypothetical protein
MLYAMHMMYSVGKTPLLPTAQSFDGLMVPGEKHSIDVGSSDENTFSFRLPPARYQELWGDFVLSPFHWFELSSD